MGKGVLYGVGVGPGDPKLMTLKAVEVIESCPVVATPRTRNGAMVALDIARGAINLSGKMILPLDFAMSHDPAVCAASHREAADSLRECLDSGRSVAMLNLGDISIYASYRYVSDILVAEGYACEMVAGVTSFCAAAAQLGESLTDIGTPIHIIPDGASLSPGLLGQGGTVIWMKSGRQLPRLLQELRDSGTEGQLMIVQNCGMANEKIYRGFPEGDIDSDYFTVVILKNGKETA